jgi:hypothetical protein
VRLGCERYGDLTSTEMISHQLATRMTSCCRRSTQKPYERNTSLGVMNCCPQSRYHTKSERTWDSAVIALGCPGCARASLYQCGSEDNDMPSLDLWANLLRALETAGTDRGKLPMTLRLSKRALRSRVSTAARYGWVGELQSGRGQVKVRLTVRGSDATTRWKSLQGSAEERWRTEIGVNRADRLRVSLEKLVGALPLEHPHYPASYGAADASITGGNGQDWRPVPRGNGDTVSDLPFSALVSQALVAFAMNYEETSPVALSLSGTVIRLIPPEGRPLQGLGDSAGISALVRHGFLRVSGNARREIVHLTPKGLSVSDAFDGRRQAVETEWHNKFGDVSIALLRRVLEEAAEAASHTKGAAR